MAGPELASAAAFSAVGAKVGGTLLDGYGKKQGQEFMAARDQRAAEIGRMRADQLDTQLRETLRTTLGNIDVIRAASNADYLSPTTAAIKDEESRVADRERNIKVGNLMNQAREDELSAGAHNWAGKMAMTSAIFDASGKAMGSFSSYGKT